MSTRITARITDETARELEALRLRTGQKRSEMIEAALREWLKKQQVREWLKKQQVRSPAEVFALTGLIGAGVGPPDLARNAKKYLARQKGSEPR